MKPIVVILILSGVLNFAARAAEAVGGADTALWIEAEDFSKGNFPPAEKNPYGPKEFWEADLLSGNRWVGARWEKGGEGYFLEYPIDVPRTGNYRLYARKFYNYGNFRWRVDDGDWQESADASHRNLDHVPFRETDERISLNWYFMGQVRIEDGKHTLRIEPEWGLTPDPDGNYIPLAYDAFLLTPELFLPQGRLRPGETHDIHTAENFSYEPGLDRFGASVIDWRSLNEQTAGELGGLEVRDGRIVFRNTGAECRLVGINIRNSTFNNEEGIAYFARYLAKKGINLARVDAGDLFSFQREEGGGIKVSLRKETTKAFLMAAGEFRKNGIYLAITWELRVCRGLDRVLDLENRRDRPGTVVHRFLFDPALREAWLTAWKRLMESELPGGGRLAQSPALALVTLMQQDSVFSVHFEPGKPGAPEMQAAGRAFGTWAVAKYGSARAALDEWGGAGLEGDDPDRGVLALPGNAAQADREDPRAADAREFLASAQREFFASAIGMLRNDLGYRGLISSGNKSVNRAPELGWFNLSTFLDGDVIERLANWQTWFEPRWDVWTVDEGSRYRDRSALRFDTLAGFEGGRFLLPTQSFQIDGKPSLLTEVSWPAPNEFRAEMLPITVTHAALQGVQVIGLAQVGSYIPQNMIAATRNLVFAPAVMGQMPAFAFAFRNGLLPAGEPGGEVSLAGDFLPPQDALPVHENYNTQIGDPLPQVAGVAPENPLVSPLTGPVRVRTAAKGVRWEDTARDPGFEGELRAAGNVVRWDYARGLLVVDAPQIQSVAGFLRKGGTQRLGAVEIRSPMEFGVICVVALDGRPLDFSEKILVQVFSRDSNTDSFAEGEDLKTIRSAGRPPILVKNFSGIVSFSRPDADLLVARALDLNGYPTALASVGKDLRLLPATMYYLITK